MIFIDCPWQLEGECTVPNSKMNYETCKQTCLLKRHVNPIPSTYGIFTYIWLIFMVNVGKYTIHGLFGNECHPYHPRGPVWVGVFRGPSSETF